MASAASSPPVRTGRTRSIRCRRKAMICDAVHEIWLVPHRDGMLQIDARIKRIDWRVSALLELLASGETVTVDMAAAVLWPAQRPERWRHMLHTHISAVRAVLPHGYVETVYGPGRGRFNWRA